MEIRSITLFSDPSCDRDAISRFFETGTRQFPVSVQTRRAALPPFPEWWSGDIPAADQATELVARWKDAGADYLCLGPVGLAHDARWIDVLPQVLGHDDALFASAEIATLDGQIDSGRCLHVARLIKATSRIRDDGFGNLYFTALANCAPGSPFFPVAYHRRGAPPSFALALEAADLALNALQSAPSLQEARQNLISAIEDGAAALEQAAQALAREHGIAFGGIDFSLAPYPEQTRSLAAAIEALGPRFLGAPGSLFVAAFITEAIDRAQFRRCGFSGLMLPVLEDAVLAQRAAEGHISVQNLLTLSAVCGVGLDTVPLPGDVDEASLAAILLDVAALAVRLDKPLTARLMPLPGLRAGDAVSFDFPYFAPSRVMSVPLEAAGGLLARDERLTLQSLASRKQ